MSKELLINQTFSECRVVLVDNGEIVNFLIDHGEEENRQHPNVGNIYLGKVVRVLPGMQSAFLDIGTEKRAFLYVNDAFIPTLQQQRKLSHTDQTSPQHSSQGKIIPDELSTLSEQIDRRFSEEAVTIESILKEGQDVVVQVAKTSISTKGPRVTRHITLAGRYVVFMPYIEHIGVSRRIENQEERERLKEILTRLAPEGRGIIARTVAAEQSHKVLKEDFNVLTKIWNNVQKSSKGIKGPKQIYNDLNFTQRILRDITDEDVDRILVDSKETLKEIDKFINKFLPSMKGKTELYSDDIPLFEKYGVDLEIERGLANTVFLRSGGSLHIDQTEALVSIDVNTGKYVGRKNLEDTVLKTNLEAVKEIVYQIRLRNSGGIIIIDFIDMKKKENREQLYSAFLEALKKDKAKTSVLPISEFGLIEMTRKRTRDTLSRIMSLPCPYCEGTGRIKSVSTVCYELIRELIKVIKKSSKEKINIYAHPEITAKLCGDDVHLMDTLEDIYGKSFVIRSENNYHIEEYEIFAHES